MPIDDNLRDVLPALLTQIRDEIRGTNQRLDRMDGRLEGVDTRLAQLDARVGEAIAGVAAYIDGQVNNRFVALEQRIADLEAARE